MTLEVHGLRADIVVTYGARRLELRSADVADLALFDGVSATAAEGYVLDVELTPHNAAALREVFPHLRPRPVGAAVSAGVGDRLGLATAGHVAAFREHGRGVQPVFAQQSIREMDRMGRTPQQVLDDATFGCVEGGWTGAVGADLDHIRSVEDIQRGIDAGFTTFTLDPGSAVREVTDPRAQVADVDWAALETEQEATMRRFVGVAADGLTTVPTDTDVAVAIVKYADAVALTARMARYLADNHPGSYEVEVALDETRAVMSAFEHHFIASELTRLGVSWVSFAPRYVDGFEKGVEFRGDRDALIQTVTEHSAVAMAHGGYKISVHSGSDKFSIYPALVEATNRRIHLKTSGTSWLVALDVIARVNPDFLREMYTVCRAHYAAASASYQVSADASGAADIASVSDAELLPYLHGPAVRQMLHVGYGEVLGAGTIGAAQRMGERIQSLLIDSREEYASALAEHLGRHLNPFAEVS